jgi:hypothetical protein
MLGAGTLNHYIVNRVMNYPLEHFACYCDLVREAFDIRGFKIGVNTIEKLNSNINYQGLEYTVVKIPMEHWVDVSVDGQPLLGQWHNQRYLRQCMYKFEEINDCGGLYQEQWNLLMEHFGNLLFNIKVEMV